MKLIIEDDEGRRTVVPFARPEMTIGRDEGNTIRLTERNVSRKHARLIRVNGHVEVEDLGSFNGIRINGEKISGPTKVTDGDLIQIGDYDLALEDEATAAAAATQPSIPPPLIPAVAPVAAIPVATVPNIPPIFPPPPPPIAAQPSLLDLPLPVEPSPETSPLEDVSNPRRQITSVIRVDILEAQRHRTVVDLALSESPQLVVLNTQHQGRTFLCSRSELTIGRTLENDIGLDHRSLSGTHAKLILEDNNEWRIIDMQSANGVLVNGEGYAQASVRFGDVLELGHVKMRFEGPGGSVSGPLARLGARSRRNLAIGAAIFLLLAIIALALAVRSGRPAPSTSNGPVSHAPAPDTGAGAPPTEPATIAATGTTTTTGTGTGTGTGTTTGTGTGTGTVAAPDVKPKPKPPALVTRPTPPAPTPPAPRTVTAPIPTPPAPTPPPAPLAATPNPKTRSPREVRVATAAPTPPAISPTPEMNNHDVAERLYSEGKTLHKKQQLREAEQAFKRCLTLEPTFARCHMMLGSTYALLKDFERGAFHYRKFLEMAPDDSNSERVRVLLQKYDESIAGGKGPAR